MSEGNEQPNVRLGEGTIERGGKAYRFVFDLRALQELDYGPRRLEPSFATIVRDAGVHLPSMGEQGVLRHSDWVRIALEGLKSGTPNEDWDEQRVFEMMLGPEGDGLYTFVNEFWSAAAESLFGSRARDEDESEGKVQAPVTKH